MHPFQVFGALWYFYAIGKLTGCWKKACQNNTGCHHSSFYCEDMISTRDYTFLNDFCSIKSGNTSDYNFGLYNDALESGIVEVTNFPKKLLHCLQWGLQNLRFEHNPNFLFVMLWLKREKNETILVEKNKILWSLLDTILPLRSLVKF